MRIDGSYALLIFRSHFSQIKLSGWVSRQLLVDPTLDPSRHLDVMKDLTSGS